MLPERSSASIAICLPGMASSVKRAPTSATRSLPLAMTTNWMIDRISEDHAADDVVAAHHEAAERLDDLARVGLEQDQARRRDVEREPEQRRDEQHGRKRRDLQRVADVERDQQQARPKTRGSAAMSRSSSEVGSGTTISPTTAITSAGERGVGHAESRPTLSENERG